ncbi:tetratricopeptide repeat protein [Adhaeretor mobilis]|uniref:Tetratricopeptide repeat protein n=1 Tax=Adhaeretor mobilis TaxID=1930276 RepID=A0A517N2E4_9BACT|nr:tetratricopeptide repeat protein [Adhaeretor mobilis]QDT01302.1 Tetratricopeptide repeat protein [Adhaeretor mobilis]
MSPSQPTLFGESQADTNLSGLSTPAMLAELLNVPVVAVRRWHRRGALLATCTIRKLPYFDFAEATIARKLASLVHAGCSLSEVDRKLDELAASLPDCRRPLADPTIVVHGAQLLERRGEELIQPGGQLLLEFEQECALFIAEEPLSDEIIAFPVSIESPNQQLNKPDSLQAPLAASKDLGDALREELLQQAVDFEVAGEFAQATETYRALLLAGANDAEVQFALADVLFMQGDISAARERYYMALELDEEFIEARLSLGCVLASAGETELAIAAFEGALELHREYADAHFHLANALQQAGQTERAKSHRETFLELAPESPWASSVREQLQT